MVDCVSRPSTFMEPTKRESSNLSQSLAERRGPQKKLLSSESLSDGEGRFTETEKETEVDSFWFYTCKKAGSPVWWSMTPPTLTTTCITNEPRAVWRTGGERRPSWTLPWTSALSQMFSPVRREGSDLEVKLPPFSSHCKKIKKGVKTDQLALWKTSVYSPMHNYQRHYLVLPANNSRSFPALHSFLMT